MTKITFALIRSQNSEIEKVEDVQEIQSIQLINCGISEIDNLELFHHITEINLSYNRITTLEKLSILYQLKILDVSFNNISAPSLLSSIKSLPKSLLSINLSGNPCVENEEALIELQDAFPEAIIAIDFDNEEKNDKFNRDVLKDEEEAENMDNIGVSELITNKASVLDTEEVLRSIVERKCRIQNTKSTFNLERTIQDLNSEMEKFIESANQKRQEKSRSRDSFFPTDDFEAKFSERKQDLIYRNHDIQPFNYHEILDRIGERARKRLSDLKFEHELLLSQKAIN